MGGKYLFQFIICKNFGIVYLQTEDLDLHALCSSCCNEVVLESDIDNDSLCLRFREIISVVKGIKNVLFRENGAEGRNFCENIRQFNLALAFASFGASIEAGCVPGQGYYSFRVQGLTYHLSSNLGGVETDKKYAQLYFIDPSSANQCRISNNSNCNPDSLIELDQILRSINGYSKFFFF